MSEIYLREITRDDLIRIQVWHNDKNLYDTLGETSRFVNQETVVEWFNQYQLNRQTQIRLAICLKENNHHIGNVNLIHMDRISQQAEFHIFIADPAERGQSHGYHATQLCLAHAFNDQNLNRIYLYVLPSNTAAINIYKKCGFQQEGICRQATFKKGQFHDLILMSLLKDEWQC